MNNKLVSRNEKACNAKHTTRNRTCKHRTQNRRNQHAEQQHAIFAEQQHAMCAEQQHAMWTQGSGQCARREYAKRVCTATLKYDPTNTNSRHGDGLYHDNNNDNEAEVIKIRKGASKICC